VQFGNAVDDTFVFFG